VWLSRVVSLLETLAAFYRGEARSINMSSEATATTKKRDLLSIMDLNGDDLKAIYDWSFSLKESWKQRKQTPVLQGCSLAMVFEKASLRTRSTFEIGIRQLGGHSIDLSNVNVGMGSRESVADIARNLDRWCDLIMMRTFGAERIETVAAEAKAPTINALTDQEHPCQVLGDVMTLMELEGLRDMSGYPLAFVGDGNNVAHSMICLGALFGMDIRVASPNGYEPNAVWIDWAQKMNAQTGGKLLISNDPYEAVDGAKAVYTDIWASMGQESEHNERLKVFTPYQVNKKLLDAAAPGAYAMHDLPARRGEEITDEVIDGPTSIVYDQAEHRLHIQKGIMVWLAEIAGIKAYQ
jgi:ornithine carbamoyltransferase